MVLKRNALLANQFVAIFCAYCLRTCMSTAAQKPKAGSTVRTMYTEWGWTDGQQGLALAAFFMGYACTQIPGGYWANKYGCKLVFGVGIVGASAVTVVTPLASSFPALIALRILTGLFEGVTYPVMMLHQSKWFAIVKLNDDAHRRITIR